MELEVLLSTYMFILGSSFVLVHVALVGFLFGYDVSISLSLFVSRLKSIENVYVLPHFEANIADINSEFER